MKGKTSAHVLVERRARGQGSIYRAPNGSFEVAYTGTDGKRHFKTLHGAKTITEARKAATAVVSQRDKGEDIAPDDLSLGDLAELFFASFESKVKSGERAARSLTDYKARYTTHIEPTL